MAIKESPSASIAAEESQIAKAVLMPGDPLRAKYVADHYLEEVVCFNTVRNMLGYTGTYKGKRISVMGHGMGVPSMGIYSYELFHFYDVDEIIRIGSAGALQDHVNVRDVVLAIGACTDSSYAHQYCLPGTFAPTADYGLLDKAVKKAHELKIPVHVGNVLSSDLFYNEDPAAAPAWSRAGAGEPGPGRRLPAGPGGAIMYGNGMRGSLYECCKSRKESSGYSDDFRSYF